MAGGSQSPDILCPNHVPRSRKKIPVGEGVGGGNPEAGRWTPRPEQVRVGRAGKGQK